MSGWVRVVGEDSESQKEFLEDNQAIFLGYLAPTEFALDPQAAVVTGSMLPGSLSDI